MSRPGDKDYERLNRCGQKHHPMMEYTPVCICDQCPNEAYQRGYCFYTLTIITLGIKSYKTMIDSLPQSGFKFFIEQEFTEDGSIDL